MRRNLTNIMSWAVVLSELSHVFCCVLPTLFSVLSLLAGLGMISVVPGFLMEWHEAIHAYEIPIILTSGAITVAAWIVYLSAKESDCHSTGCVHEPCGPRKSRAYKVLMVGTVLFVVNVTIFLFLHYLPEHGFDLFGLNVPAQLEPHSH